jgi:2-polyprenyl-3-methyl-5-hydroxy-6-metoxy-1,4-benzoquinol methylase
MKCRICDSSIDTPVYKVREMYFGTRDEFEYQQCAACACLQIVAIPENLGQYYPDDYYSKHVKQQYRDHAPPSALRELKLNACLGKRRLLSLVLFFLREPRLPPWVAYLDINSRTRILDVGCGAGKLLLKLGKKGFRFLEGVDPFIDETITYDNGVKIYKNQIWNIAREEDARNGYDLVMMHHSLEHIPDQHRTLSAAYDLLNKNGLLLIRVPLSCSWAWQHYRENWVQIDSPRHLYLHSIKSIEVLAQKHGFSLQEVHFDSTQFQFTGSERYRRDIPLFEKEEADVFTTQEIQDYSVKADELNREGAGDQACFILRKAA